MLCVRADIPGKLVGGEISAAESLHMEINFRKTKWSLCWTPGSSPSLLSFFPAFHPAFCV